jgi:hypothetical protein
MFLSSRLQGVNRVPPGPSDPYFSSVTLLLLMDSLPFSDLKGNTINNLNTTLTTTSTKFTGAAVFNGVDTVLRSAGSTPLSMGTGDFTQEAWIKIGSYPASQCIVWTNAPATGTGFSNTTIGLNLMSSGIVRVQSSYTVFLTGSTVIPLNTWTHVTFTRSGSTMRLFINGVLDASATVANNFSDTTDFLMGKEAYNTNNTGATFNGQIDELRVTKGVARYTANFTPSDAPFPSR